MPSTVCIIHECMEECFECIVHSRISEVCELYHMSKAEKLQHGYDDDDDDDDDDDHLDDTFEELIQSINRNAHVEDDLVETVERSVSFSDRSHLLQYGPSIHTNFSIPFEDVVSAMMGPLYYDIHLPLLEDWKQYLHRLVTNVSSDGRLIGFNPLFHRRSLNVNTVTGDQSLANVSRLNIQYLKLIISMLQRQRANDNQDLLSGRRRPSRSLQEVYDNCFMSRLFHESKLPVMPYLQSVDLLYVWRELLQQQYTKSYQSKKRKRKRETPTIYYRVQPGQQRLSPAKATLGSSAFDLFSNETVTIEPQSVVKVSTGIFNIQLPAGYCAYILSRSGLALNCKIIVFNAPGLIDNDYRGVLYVLLYNGNNKSYTVCAGDRIAQFQLCACNEINWQQLKDSEMPSTSRGSGGFGSTGK